MVLGSAGGATAGAGHGGVWGWARWAGEKSWVVSDMSVFLPMEPFIYSGWKLITPGHKDTS